jgi:hypothetical protein
MGTYIHIFLTLALARDKWSVSCPGRFTHGERAPGTLWIGGSVDPRDGLDDVENRKFFALSGLELRPLGRLARSQMLCKSYINMYLGPIYADIINILEKRFIFNI